MRSPSGPNESCGVRPLVSNAKEGYWAEQTEIQRRSASAWLAFVERREADALAEMRAAATLEDSTEKSAVTPGPLAPARELLGEMLLELKEPAQARKEFEATLKKEPNTAGISLVKETTDVRL